MQNIVWRPILVDTCPESWNTTRPWNSKDSGSRCWYITSLFSYKVGACHCLLLKSRYALRVFKFHWKWDGCFSCKSINFRKTFLADHVLMYNYRNLIRWCKRMITSLSVDLIFYRFVWVFCLHFHCKCIYTMCAFFVRKSYLSCLFRKTNQTRAVCVGIVYFITGFCGLQFVVVNVFFSIIRQLQLFYCEVLY